MKSIAGLALLFFCTFGSPCWQIIPTWQNDAPLVLTVRILIVQQSVFAVTNESYMLILVTWKHTVYACVSLTLVLMSHQDITECTGPQSRLTELNAEVKKSFHNLRLRIQVRNASFEYLCKHHRTPLWPVHQPLARFCMITDGSQNICAMLFLWQDFEQMAMEQDKESDKQALISQVEGHRKQMLR